jgi:subtilisin family serine protease
MTTPRTPFALVKPLALAVLVGWSLLLSPEHVHGPTKSALRAAAASTPDSIPGAQSQGELSRAEILERLGVPAWHRAGHKGKGVTVAVLDTGFRGYKQQLGKALPAKLTVRSFRPDHDLEAKDSQHGILCAEVFHAIAPEAEMLLANWDTDDPNTFLDAVRWAKEQGARVLTCSVIMPSWSDGEGGGPVHEALKEVLGAEVLMFASAGNTAQRHWSGEFRGGRDACHEWARGGRWNGVRPWGSERVSVELCARPGGDYEVTVEDATTDRTLGKSETRHDANRDCAVVRFWPQAGHAYRLKVRLVRGNGGSFHLVALGGGLEHATAPGSVPFPGDGAEVIAVGAVDAAGKRWSYSSCGPNSAQPKPDLSATVPFPSAWRTLPFSGTSAASPQAAALAALVWARDPRESAATIRAKLRDAAERLGTGKHDCETGFGRIRLPR